MAPYLSREKPQAGGLFFRTGDVVVIGDDSGYLELERAIHAGGNLFGVCVENFRWQMADGTVTGKQIRCVGVNLKRVNADFVLRAELGDLFFF